MHYGRTLISDEEISAFVGGVLGITNQREMVRAISLIAGAERELRGCDNASTLNDPRFRDFRYKDESRREELRERILNELKRKVRLDDDDKIRLGKGGAAPRAGAAREKQLFYLIGPPASGKSGIATAIAEAARCYTLDSDFAKRKFPEYSHTNGASMVHDEADDLIFGRDAKNLLNYCVKEGYNIVLPKIGAAYTNVCNFAERMRDLGYKTYLISVDLDRIKATRRAYNRFAETRRYVPLSLIFDAYSNEPTLNYFKIKQRCAETFDGFAQISTDVERGKRPVLVENIEIPVLQSIYGGASYVEEADSAGRQGTSPQARGQHSVPRQSAASGQGLPLDL